MYVYIIRYNIYKIFHVYVILPIPSPWLFHSKKQSRNDDLCSVPIGSFYENSRDLSPELDNDKHYKKKHETWTKWFKKLIGKNLQICLNPPQFLSISGKIADVHVHTTFSSITTPFTSQLTQITWIQFPSILDGNHGFTLTKGVPIGVVPRLANTTASGSR
jgi:hypothetical protein